MPNEAGNKLLVGLACKLSASKALEAWVAIISSHDLAAVIE
jgi:hypothetical protein